MLDALEDMPDAADDDLARYVARLVMHRALIAAAPSPCVYVVQAGERGPVKIGRATHLAKRMCNLQSSNHDRLWVRAVVPGGAEQERRMHQAYRRARIRGEWFAVEHGVGLLVTTGASGWL